MDINERLTFTQSEAAALLGVSRRTLIEWAKRKKPVPFRSGGPGKACQYDGRELVAWFVEHSVRQDLRKHSWYFPDDLDGE